MSSDNMKVEEDKSSASSCKEMDLQHHIHTYVEQLIQAQPDQIGEGVKFSSSIYLFEL